MIRIAIRPAAVIYKDRRDTGPPLSLAV